MGCDGAPGKFETTTTSTRPALGNAIFGRSRLAIFVSSESNSTPPGERTELRRCLLLSGFLVLLFVVRASRRFCMAANLQKVSDYPSRSIWSIARMLSVPCPRGSPMFSLELLGRHATQRLYPSPEILT
jgi:hypothetical protein